MSQTATSYRLTTISCFVGIFVQAIITNITAILFVPLMNMYGFSYIHLGTLVGINFSTQVASDLIFSGLIDKLGFRKLALPSGICAFAGLILFAMAPFLFENVFIGLILATIIASAASGLLEVLLSPIINAIPNDHKGPAMSLMHSFYAWGQVATIIVTTLFIFVFGARSWQIILLIWAMVPLINFIMFLKAPFPDNIPEEHRLSMRDLILKPYCLLAFAAIFFGASTEVVMNQWSSTFMENALLLPKVTGDLLGMSGFATMLGVGRVLYGKYGAKLNINNILIYTSLFSIACYIIVALSPLPTLSVVACILCGFAVSLLWPGTLIITANRYPLAGAWIFAILAAAGDVGAAVGPWITGFVADNFTDSSFVISFSETLQITPEQAAIRTGILCAAIFPILAFVCHFTLKRMGNIKPALCLKKQEHIG